MGANDNLLLERWIDRRDGEAFTELVRRHAGLVYGVCRRVLGNPADAEDVAQECFLRLARSTRTPRSSLAGWLYRLATHRSLDLRKADVRRRRREEAAARRPAREEPGWEEIQPLVDEAIARLPENLRQVVIACFLEQRTQEAVAAEIGVSRQTVSGRVGQAIHRIRENLRRRGIPVTAAALSPLLESRLVEAAPPSLAGVLGKLALAGTAGAASGMSGPAMTPPTLIVSGGIATMAKLKIAAGIATVVVSLLLIGYAVRTGREPLPGRAGVDPVAREVGIEAIPPGKDTDSDSQTPKAPAAADPNRTIRGQVVDAAGERASGARVAAGRLAGERLGEGTADAMGQFSMELPEPGRYLLGAYREGVGIGAVLDAPTGEEELEIRLEALGALRGRIFDRDFGQGLDGVAFELSFIAFEDRRRATVFSWFDIWNDFKKPRREPGGHYGAERLPAARYLFKFDVESSSHSVPGFNDLPPFQIDLEAGEERDGLDIALEAAGAASGTVLGPDGRPIVGAQVHIASSRHSFETRRAKTTDAAGRFRFGALRTGGSYAVVANFEGLAQGHSETIILAEAVELEGVDVHLVAGHSVFGRIVDEEGRGVSGASFRLAKSLWRSLSDFSREETVSAEDGFFRIDRVGAGDYCFVPQAEGFDSGAVLSLRMPADSDLRDQVFAMKRKKDGSVSGRVTDREGRPIAGVRVLADNDQKGPRATGEGLTDQDGRYRLSGLGQASSFRISVYPDNFAMEERPRVPLNATDVDFILDRFGRISGQVLDNGTGKPVQDFEVRARSFRNRPEGIAQEWWVEVRSEDGTFALDRVEPPLSQFEVRADGYAPWHGERTEIMPGATVEAMVRLNRGAAIRGRILDARSGRPLAGARVRAHDQGYFHSTLITDQRETLTDFEVVRTTDGDGRFELGGLSLAKELDLVVWLTGYGVRVEERVTAPAEVDLHLEREARLTVRIHRGGEPAEGVLASLSIDGRGDWRRGYWDGAWTSRDGIATLAGLPAGRYRIALHTKEEEQLGILTRDLAAGESEEVDLELDDLHSRYGAVVGTVSGGTSFVSVSIHPAASAEIDYGRASSKPEDRRIRLGGLPPGDYLIKAWQEEPRVEKQLPVHVRAGEETRLEIRLEP